MRVLMIVGLLVAATAVQARECEGTFLKHTCGLGAGDPEPGPGVNCGYDKKKGERAEFIGYEDEGGRRYYVVYRLDAYRAENIRLKSGCKLKRY